MRVGETSEHIAQSVSQWCYTYIDPFLLLSLRRCDHVELLVIDHIVNGEAVALLQWLVLDESTADFNAPSWTLEPLNVLEIVQCVMLEDEPSGLPVGAANVSGG